MRKLSLVLTMIAVSQTTVGCAGDDMAGEFGFSSDGGVFEADASGKAGPDTCDTDDDCSLGYVCFQEACLFQGSDTPPPLSEDPPPLPPEEDVISQMVFSPPAAGREQVFIASPITDSVVRIHGDTLAIDTIEVGDEPTIALTLPGRDEAVVLNRGSDSLSFVTEEGVETWRLSHHFNALVLDPTGRYALCWFDLSDARSGEDAEALQDMVVVDLADGSMHSVTIGFRPTRVSFTADGAQALVVTDDGLSVFEPAVLGERSIAYNVPVALNLLDQSGRDVKVSPDGEYVISRKANEHGVTIVSRAQGVPRFVPFESTPTDLELLPDGRALVMLRDESRLALIDLEDALNRALEAEAFMTYISFEDHLLGSVAIGASGEVAVLYTTLTAEFPEVGLLDLESGQLIFRPMRKGVRGVAIENQGRTAFILHTKAPGEPDPTLGDASFVARSYGYSLLDLATNFVKLQTTPGPVAGLSFAGSDEAFALISLPGADVAAVHHIDLIGFEVRP